MSKQKIFAIPDIHGRSDLLDLLWQKMPEEGYDPGRDKVIFLGDMVDRGPDSKGVLDRVQSWIGQGDGRVIALAGNHEWLMINGVMKRKVVSVKPEAYHISQHGGIDDPA